MYNQSYDDYIRSVLGYPNVYSQDYFQNYNESDIYDYGQNRNDELEDCYPEIYKIVYPMVQKRCQNTESPITKENIDSIVEELYLNLEENRQTENNKMENRQKETKEVRQTRQFNNSGIMDIIRILLLRELLGRPNRPGNRPPFPPPNRPGRPPFPPNRPGRPPYYREYGDIYEY